MNGPEKISIESSIEQEPSKRIIFVRHPSQKWFDSLVDQATERGDDIETDLPVDQEGLKMVHFLSDYLQSELGDNLTDGEYNLYSSPIKRAREEAEILHKKIKLSKLDKPNLPAPRRNEVEDLDFFSEVSLTTDKSYARDLITRAKERGIHPVVLWFEEKGSDLLPRFQAKMEQVIRGMEYLKEQPTKLDIVVSHRLVIAVTIWVNKHPEKTNDPDYRLTLDDLKEIFDYSGNLPFTSLTEMDVIGDRVSVKTIGLTPHLSGDSEKERLIKGKY